MNEDQEMNMQPDDVVELIDEDGKEVRFEHLMTLEHKGSNYICLVPLDPMEDVGEDELVILKIETDEDGNELELEYVDTLEYQGQIYMAFFPTVDEDTDPDSLDDDEEYGLIILKVIHVDGEDQLTTLDSDEEAEAVYQQFAEALFDEDDEDE